MWCAMLVGRRSTIVRASDTEVEYSLFLIHVAVARAIVTKPSAAVAAMRERTALGGCRRRTASASHSQTATTTASTTTAINGKYMRRSAPTSVERGTTL